MSETEIYCFRDDCHQADWPPLDAALPDPKVLELCMIQGPLQWGILKEKPVIKDGYLELPDAPGLGVDIADDLEERFPYIEGHYAVRVER